MVAMEAMGAAMGAVGATDASGQGSQTPTFGSDRITVFDASENREYRIPVAAIARISILEDLDDKRRWTKIG
jgi:hypothetical protein